MRMLDLIEKKKEKRELSNEEIKFIVNGFTKGDIPDYQMAAFLMAVRFTGMTENEILNLTLAMRDSGDVLDLSRMVGLKVDKHSSGGVGDKTTILLAPLVASCGMPVAKMSGRGLGHTGGTIDKLESFPGFMTALPEDMFFDNVEKHGIAVAGQTANLAPADKKMYALRDATATVDSIPLIASSIMSKKLAAGADAIVLDVKVGDGAFMKDLKSATDLATEMVTIGRNAGKQVTAVLTQMDQPLGNAVGNILEVKEAIASLKGKGPDDLMEVVFALGSRMLLLGKKVNSLKEGEEMLKDAISSGRAFDKFKEFVEAQKGDSSYAEHPENFPEAAIVEDVYLEDEGYISAIKAEKIGHACMVLGGGRAEKDDVIDLTVGCVMKKKVGSFIKKDDAVLTLYANDREKMEQAKAEVISAFTVTDEVKKPLEMILGEV
ncbi:MAG: pyrimidine-nucleoside phosphorylase [Lachnospiraceae bacterium]|nr:pyrimidine-nucleoside phosphorylase [Lachnospiraceae bacterium]